MPCMDSVTLFGLLYAFFSAIVPEEANGALVAKQQELINLANSNGSYLGIVIPNLFEMNPLLQHPNFTSSDLIIDYQGKWFIWEFFGKMSLQKNHAFIPFKIVNLKYNLPLTTKVRQLISWFNMLFQWYFKEGDFDSEPLPTSQLFWLWLEWEWYAFRAFPSVSFSLSFIGHLKAYFFFMF